MESRDNASVFLSRPHVITFGTIFLAGLRSDEGMISVLAHELMHVADGDNDSLRPLVCRGWKQGFGSHRARHSRAAQRGDHLRSDWRDGCSCVHREHARLRVHCADD